MKPHYQNLGVAETATPDEIKAAYRAKAKSAHPDAGGSAEEFAPIAQAYEVLSNPERRMLYDATGADTRKSVEVEAEAILMQGFQGAINSDTTDEPGTSLIRKSLEQLVLKFQTDRVKLEKREVELKSKRERFKSTAEVNLAHRVIDAELKSITGNLLNIEHQTKVIAKALEMLETYTEEWTAPPKPMYRTMDMRYSQINADLVNPFGRRG